MLLIALTILILSCSVEQNSALSPTTAISFEYNSNSCMMLKMNMEPVEKAISVCSWVNKKRTDGNRDYDTWFTYNAPRKSPDILITGSIRLNAYMLQNHLENSQSVPANEWHHVCITWSFESKKSILYFDGENIAEEESGYTNIAMNGTMAIGQYHTSANMQASFNSNHYFGGQLLKMNIYKRQLTAEEVGEMYSSGKCSQYEDTLVADVFLGWNTILHATKRLNDVRDVLVTCPGDEWDVLYSTDFYDKLVNSELMKKLRGMFDDLATLVDQKIQKPLIEHLRKFHRDQN